MKYAASSEASMEADSLVHSVHNLFDPELKELIVRSILSSLDGTLIYVPIIMPVEMHEKYTERSRFVKSSNRYESCPHLSFASFTGGRIDLALQEYTRGLREAAPNLASLGASEDQIAEFCEIVEKARGAAVRSAESL